MGTVSSLEVAMQVSLSKYRRSTGWQPPLPSAMDGPGTLLLVFGGSRYAEDPEPFFALADAFPKAVHAGCSSEGSGDGPADAPLCVAVMRFESVGVAAATLTVRRREDSLLMGAALGAQLPHGGLRMAFLLGDGGSADGEALLRGLRGSLPRCVPLAGGLAGDRAGQAKPWIYGADGHLPAPGRACVVGLYGERLRFGQGHARGWQCLSMPLRVTRARGKVLYELAGLPALAEYKRHLAQHAKGLPGTALAFPLAVTDMAGGAPSIRSVLAVDECRGALVLSGEVPEQAVVRLMHARPDDLQGSSERAAQQALSALPAGARSVMISVGCPARQWLAAEAGLAQRSAMQAAGFAGMPQVGFNSFGEVGLPVGSGGGAQLHHQTQAFTALAEA